MDDASSPEETSQPKPKKLSKAERKALEEQRKRAAAREAAKRGPKNAPKLGKFNVDREKADEQLRVVGLHKEFAERGKVPPKMIYPLFIKELFKPIKPESLIPKLVASAKEVLAAKAGDKGLAAGDFVTWYFESAWPTITEARGMRAPAASSAAVMKRPPTQASVPPGLAEASARAGRVQHTGAMDAASDADDGDDESSDASTDAPEPAARVAARGVDVAEARRLLTVLGEYAVDGEGDRGAPELLIPPRMVMGALHKALMPISDDTLLARAPKPSASGRGVPLGALVKFWFDAVWPKHKKALGREGDSADGVRPKALGAMADDFGGAELMDPVQVA